jgi:DNA-binding NtrC family response regulator
MSIRQINTAGYTRQPLVEPWVEDSHSEAFECQGASDRSEWVLLGESAAARRLRSQIQRIAPYFRIALIRGEKGSGKRAVARAIHKHSRGASGPFIEGDVSPAESGSGGEAPRQSAFAAPSLLEAARGGTLYLPDVGELPFDRQAALLHFLRDFEERRFTPPDPPHGANPREQSQADPLKPKMNAQNAGTRILAGSDRDLRTLAAIGQFRQDLFARLSAVEIIVPPLRQRLEDIPLLAGWLLRWLAEESGQCPKVLAEATISQFQRHLWPTNLRELERVVAQAAALAEGGFIEPRHLLALVEPEFAGPTAADPVRIERLHEVIERHVLDVLNRCGGNKLRAAEVLGISRSTLYRMLGAKTASMHMLLE